MKKILGILACVVCMCTFSGCYENVNIGSTNHTNGIYVIDTINIHSAKHEIIVYSSGAHRGGIMHSPECWCLADSYK